MGKKRQSEAQLEQLKRARAQRPGTARMRNTHAQRPCEVTMPSPPAQRPLGMFERGHGLDEEEIDARSEPRLAAISEQSSTRNRDEWTAKADRLVRHHANKRRPLFTPKGVLIVICANPLKSLGEDIRFSFLQT